MKPLRVSENVVPISELKAQAAEWVRRLGEEGRPLVVTQNGRPAAVLLSPQAYDELTERARFVASVEAGLADDAAGRVIPHAEVVRRVQKRFGKPRR